MLNSRNLQVVILVFILAAASAGGYAVVQHANELARNRNEGPFSRERVAADKAFESRQYLVAVDHFRKMTVQDPYNCWAHLYLGRSLLQLILDDEKASAAEGGMFGDFTSPDNASGVDADIRNSWFEEAYAAFDASSGLKALNAASKYHIARLHYLQKDYPRALELLSVLPPGGTRFQRTMDVDFATLNDQEDYRDEFRAIVDRQIAVQIP